MKYIVRIEELFIKDVIVEAEDIYDAEDIVQDLYSDGKIEVNVKHFESSSVDALREADNYDEQCYECVN